MRKLGKTAQYFLAGIIFIFAILYALFYTTSNPRYDLIFKDGKMLWQGVWNTIYISIITLVLSMLLGFVLFLMMRSKIAFIKALAIIFKEIVMGTPLLVMIFLAVYVLGNLINIGDKIILGIIALTLYMSPYLANAYETAIAVIDRDQYTVMDIYNFKGYQKYLYVIFPQMIKPLIPSLINNLSSIVKGSALLKIVSVTEISYVITVISSKNWAAIEGYYVMWLLYLCITIPLSLLAQFIGKKVSR